MSRKVYENPEVLANGDPSDIYSIAVAASLTDYRPTHWDTVRCLLANSENITRSEKKDIIWMKFAAALCVLDIFRLDVLTKCLDETFLHALFTNRSMLRHWQLRNHSNLCCQSSCPILRITSRSGNASNFPSRNSTVYYHQGLTPRF
jgi:hypothetical protein